MHQYPCNGPIFHILSQDIPEVVVFDQGLDFVADLMTMKSKDKVLCINPAVYLSCLEHVPSHRNHTWPISRRSASVSELMVGYEGKTGRKSAVQEAGTAKVATNASIRTA